MYRETGSRRLGLLRVSREHGEAPNRVRSLCLTISDQRGSAADKGWSITWQCHPSRPRCRALCPAVLSVLLSQGEELWAGKAAGTASAWKVGSSSNGDGTLMEDRAPERGGIQDVPSLAFTPSQGKKLFVNSSLTAPLATQNHIKAGQSDVPGYFRVDKSL